MSTLSVLDADDRVYRLERRLDRERRARLEAERLLEAKSLELYHAGQQLIRFAADLERRVEERTRELGVAREHALQLAECDQLTGLANRMRFLRLLDEAFCRHAGEGGGFTLFLLDVDRFKEINDTLGHGAGDRLLQALAQRLAEAVGSGDVVARIGGDEFAVVCGRVLPADAARAMADDMLARVRQPVGHEGRVMATSCSIGIAACPDHAATAVDLQRFADLALYRSKTAGRSTHTVFDAAMKDEVLERQALIGDLEQAIRRGEIEPWFQSVVDTTTRRVAGVEALARWRHPTRGVLAPAAFIGLVETCGLMDEMFDLMLTAACAVVAPWIAAGLVGRVAVNVSPSQFRRPTLAADIVRRLAEIGFPADRLTIEITEDVLLQDLAGASLQIEELARHGIWLAIDDFGAGYANIGYLRQLPIHTLKLDRMLTAAVTTDPKAKAVLRGLVEIANALSLDVVAEGVETVADASCLADLGCGFLQGYLFGRPMPAIAWEAAARGGEVPGF